MKMSLNGILYLVAIGGAVLLGLLQGLNIIPTYTWMTVVLVLAGLGVGLMNISIKEGQSVMTSALLLGLGAGVLTQVPAVGSILESIFAKIAFVSVPVAIPVALMTIIKKSR